MPRDRSYEQSKGRFRTTTSQQSKQHHQQQHQAPVAKRRKSKEAIPGCGGGGGGTNANDDNNNESSGSGGTRSKTKVGGKCPKTRLKSRGGGPSAGGGGGGTRSISKDRCVSTSKTSNINNNNVPAFDSMTDNEKFDMLKALLPVLESFSKSREKIVNFAPRATSAARNTKPKSKGPIMGGGGGGGTSLKVKSTGQIPLPPVKCKPKSRGNVGPPQSVPKISGSKEKFSNVTASGGSGGSGNSSLVKITTAPTLGANVGGGGGVGGGTNIIIVSNNAEDVIKNLLGSMKLPTDPTIEHPQPPPSPQLSPSPLPPVETTSTKTTKTTAPTPPLTITPSGGGVAAAAAAAAESKPTGGSGGGEWIVDQSQLEALYDKQYDLATNVKTVQDSYERIVRSLVSLQNRRSGIPKNTMTLLPRSDSSLTNATATMSGHQPSSELERFMSPATRNEAFKVLFEQVETLQKEMAQFTAFFNSEGYIDMAKYEQNRITVVQYDRWNEEVTSLAKIVDALLQEYNKEVLELFRIKPNE